MMYFHQHYHLNVTRTFLSKPLAKVCISDQHSIFKICPISVIERLPETPYCAHDKTRGDF